VDANALADACDGPRYLLNRWDPIGVYDEKRDFPPDEYDCLIGPLMSLLNEGADVAQVSELLWFELEDHFGLDPEMKGSDSFAEKLVAWFHSLDTAS
jgi:hypothetical protein